VLHALLMAYIRMGKDHGLSVVRYSTYCTIDDHWNLHRLLGAIAGTVTYITTTPYIEVLVGE
jgi:hypothetical protein